MKYDETYFTDVMFNFKKPIWTMFLEGCSYIMVKVVKIDHACKDLWIRV